MLVIIHMPTTRRSQPALRVRARRRARCMCVRLNAPFCVRQSRF